MKKIKEKQYLKIGIIGHKRIPSNEGGVEKGVEEHAVRMQSLGHSVTVYNRGSDNIYGKEYNKKIEKSYKGVRIVTIPTPKGNLGVVIYSFLATVHALFCGYDVISYRASGPCVMIALAKLFGQRCIASLHGFDSQREKWGKMGKRYLSMGERIAATMADACLVLSENMRKHIKETYGTDAICFANGADHAVPLEASLIKEKWNLGKDKYVLSLGRIEPEKGLHFLIEAFRQCKTDLQLVIGGGESNQAYFQRLQQMAEGDDRIRFLYSVDGDWKRELFSNAYLFALPSNLEGMANTLLEAMSLGNCCLVSDIPENTEVVTDHALCFECGNAGDLQEKLQYLLDNPDVVESLKKTSSEYIRSRYDWDIVVEQMLRVYRGEKVDYRTVWQDCKEKWQA